MKLSKTQIALNSLLNAIYSRRRQLQTTHITYDTPQRSTYGRQLAGIVSSGTKQVSQTRARAISTPSASTSSVWLVCPKNADAIPKAKSIGHTSISQSPTILTRQYLQRHMNTMPLWIKDWRCLQLDQQPDQGSAD